jgi:hypothetical protein
MSEIEKEDIVAKLPRPISSGGTASATTLKYCGVNFLKKDYVDRETAGFYGHSVHLHLLVSVNLFVFRSVPWMFKCTPNMRQICKRCTLSDKH